MKRGVWVFLVCALVFSFVFYFNALGFYEFFSDMKSQITGEQILEDDYFIREASEFGGGSKLAAPTVSLSPNGTEGPCIMQRAYWNNLSSPFEDSVELFVEGKNCHGSKINLNIYEKDFLFDDFVRNIEVLFVGDLAHVKIEIKSNFNYLFREAFEGDELEVYFEVENGEVRSDLIIITKDGILLQPTSSFVRGCGTAEFIDWDCDGYGPAIRSDGVYGQSDLYGNMPDADDNDPNVNTPQSVAAVYGSPTTNLQNLRNFLAQLGYNPERIYFVDRVNGNDLTGAVNDITRPYRTWDEIRCEGGGGRCSQQVGNWKFLQIQPGDMVLFREGNYPSNEGIDMETPLHNFVSGTPTQPIILMAYPGEKVVFTGLNGPISIGGSSSNPVSNVILDGFIAACISCGLNSNVMVQIGYVTNVVIRNTEALGGKWGFWGGGMKLNLLLDRVVAHNQNQEHGIYMPGMDNVVYNTIIVRNSLSYKNPRTGFQLNGMADNILLEGNVFHSNGLSGITFTNGAQHSIVRNNLIFNNNRAGVVMFTNVEPVCQSPTCRRSNDDNLFVNNIFWLGQNSNGLCSGGCDPVDQPAIDINDVAPEAFTYTNNVFRNNIFVTHSRPIFLFRQLRHISSSLIENNIFYRIDGNEPSGLWSLETDLTNTGTIGQSPTFYSWSLSAFQNQWSSFVRNNIFVNPQFTDVNVNYHMTPEFFNFYPLPSSPTINFGVGNPGVSNIPSIDIRGNPRIFPVDAGAYEYTSGGSNGPILNSITPPTVPVETTTPLNFNGNNFNSNAFIQICPGGSNCVDIPSGFTFVNSNLIRFDSFFAASAGTYSFRVRNPDNQVSTIRSIVAQQPTPNAPSNLAANALSSTSIGLTWTDNSNNEEGFSLEYKLNSAPTTAWVPVPGASNLPAGSVISGTITYTQNSLITNTAYNYRVRAYRDGGASFSAWSNVATATTPQLAAPSGLTVTTPAAPAGQTQLVLNWADNSNDEVSFEIQRRQAATNPAWAWITVANVLGSSAATGTFTDTGRTSGTYYEYHMRAVNVGGVSLWYPLTTASPPYVSGTTLYTLPLAPTGLTAVSQSTGSVLLTWTDNAVNENGYWIGRCIGATCTNYAAVNTPLGNGNVGINAVTFTDTGLTTNTVYRYVVSAFNPAGSVPSNPASTTTFTCTPLMQESCSNQVGVCAGTVRTCGSNGQWGTCDYTTRSNYALTETGSNLCRDGFDNDCDGRADYTGPRTASTPPDGDDGCAVSVTAITAPSQVSTSSNFNLDCTSSVANINSIIGSLDGVACNFVNWIGNAARFNCLSSSVAVTQVARCTVDTSKSYQTGGALTSNVIVTNAACSTYSSSNTCEGNSACDWCLGCSSTNPSWSNGFANRCVASGSCSSGNYMCRSSGTNTCGATCDGTTNNCGPSALCNLNSCGCVEQDPVISGINPLNFAWGSNGIVLTVTGSYFASDSQLLVDGTAISSSRLNRSPTSLQFTYNSREFRSGPHAITVRNPTSGRVSNPTTLTLTTNPVISSLAPQILPWNIGGFVDIIGTDLDPYELEINGLFRIPFSYGLWSSTQPELVRFLVVSGIDAGDYDISIINNDMSESNSARLRVNYPFDYLFTLSTSSVGASPSSSFNVDVRLDSVSFMAYEDVVLSVEAPTGIVVTPLGADRCTPNLMCTLSFSVNVGNVASGDYPINFTGVSILTSKTHQDILTVSVATVAPSTGSGSGGGGGGGSSRRSLTQCSDGIDNDGDRLIDYPEDLGCNTASGNNEINIESIVTPGNYSFGEEQTEEEASELSEEEMEIKLVFWTVLFVLIAGILVVGIIIIKSLRKSNNFEKSIINSKSSWVNL